MKTLRLNNKTNKYNADEMINEFLLLQQQKGVVKTTLRSHLYALQDLHKGCTGIPTEQDIRRCLPPNISNAYHNKRLSTYRQYYDMLIDFGHILNNPTMKWGYKKISFNIKNYDECNIRKFLEAIDKSTFAGLRDYVMCLFIIDTGIRPSEVVQLKKEDVNFETRQVHLRGEITKTRTARTVPMSSEIIAEIRKLIHYELEEWNNPYLFCNSDDYDLIERTLRRFSDPNTSPYEDNLSVKIKEFLRNPESEKYIEFAYKKYKLDKLAEEQERIKKELDNM